MQKALLAGFLSLALVLSFTAAGCGLFQPQTERNPANETPQRPEPNPVPSRLAPQGNTAEAMPIPGDARARAVLADTYAAEVESVRGVRDATAVIDGRTVLVGVRMNEAELTPALEQEVRRQLLLYDTRLAGVKVTADSLLVNEIARLAALLRQGTPLGEIGGEIRSLRRRMEQGGA